MRRRLVIGLCAAFLAACHPAAGPGRTSFPSRRILMAGEIAASAATSVYQAVLQLRPEFLRRTPPWRSNAQPDGGVRVFLDESEVGGVEALYDIPLGNVTVIRYLEPSESTLRWGPTYADGVIQVSTARGMR